MAAPVADTKKELDDAFTEAIKQINALIEKTQKLKAAYSEGSTETSETLKSLKAEKQALSAKVQATLADINRMLGVAAPAVAAEEKPAAAAAAEPVVPEEAAAKGLAEGAAAKTLAAAVGEMPDTEGLEGASGGGRKPAKKTAGKPKRAQKGGADAAVAPGDAVPPSVYNIQGLMTQNHNPYLVASDANIAAMSRIHTPFSAGVVGEINQQTTAELSTGLVGRMTPQPPMAGGAAKRKSAKTGAAKKR